MQNSFELYTIQICKHNKFNGSFIEEEEEEEEGINCRIRKSAFNNNYEFIQPKFFEISNSPETLNSIKIISS